jgi:transcription initiation factor TFIIB
MEMPECEACGSDNIVTDTKEGHMVCSDCGVIMRQSMISSNSEYRNFSESDKPTGESGSSARLEIGHGTFQTPHPVLPCTR